MSVEFMDDNGESFDDYVESITSHYDKHYPSNKDRNLMISHPWHGVSVGKNAPEIVNAIIEIPALARVKTELDKNTGLLRVDRVLHSSVIYPANYGFIPNTLAEDNDPLDILVLCQLSVPPLSLMKVRPIGYMPMTDGDESDDKIIAVAVTDPEYAIYYDINELPPFKLLMISQFFNDYKTLERKRVDLAKPKGAETARRVIQEAIDRYKAEFTNSP